MSFHTQNEALIETRLSILTWNLWWRYGPFKQRRNAIVATLKKIDADVIGLQEIWNDETADFAAELADVLGYHHVFDSTKELDGFGCGNAVLSRWPISQHDAIILHGRNEDPEIRGATFAQIEGPRGPIPVFCTHLNWKFQDSHIRQRQVAELARFVANKRPWLFPPVVCGDFNAEPDSDEMRILVGLSKCPVEDLFFHDAWLVADKIAFHDMASAVSLRTSNKNVVDTAIGF